MNRKILDRPMFQNRQHYSPGGAARKIWETIKKPADWLKPTTKPITELGDSLGDRLKKLNQWDKNLSPLADGSIPIRKKPTAFPKNILFPNRKSMKGVYLGGAGLSGYNLLAPDAPNNNISGDKIKEKAETIGNKINELASAAGNTVGDKVGAFTESINTENNEKINNEDNLLSRDIFADKNNEVEVAEANLNNEVNNKMDMNLKISPLNQGATNYAEQQNIDQIDMTRVNAIKEQLSQLVGDPTDSNNINMLLQLGASLMSGKTLKGGLAGFFDVAGQAGLQILPQMLAISDRKNSRDSELALAAFELVQEANNKDDNFGPGKGTMVYPHQIQYKMENGEYVKDEGGNFIPTGYTPVGSGFGFSKDYQSQGMMNANSVLTSQGQPPLYTLLDAATTGASGAFGANDVVYATEGNSDAAIKYATVLERGLPRIADML